MFVPQEAGIPEELNRQANRFSSAALCLPAWCYNLPMNMNLHMHLGLAGVLALGLWASAVQANEPRVEPATAPATQPAAPPKITLTDFVKKRTEPDTVVLDVRTPREFSLGHVPGAINIDWHSRQFNDRINALDKSKTYLVHCAAGVRSAGAAKRMQSLQFDSLFDYNGGFMEYEKSGQPIEK